MAELKDTFLESLSAHERLEAMIGPFPDAKYRRWLCMELLGFDPDKDDVETLEWMAEETEKARLRMNWFWSGT